MRKSSILIILLVLCMNAMSQVAPMGMKYQAVARDLAGSVLADKQINLQITLAGNSNNSWTNYYTESHTVLTSKLGLFTLVLGEGKSGMGTFKAVPWSSQDIWMEIALKTNGSYAAISNSKLLAVPYAFHALTANELVNAGGENLTGIPSNTWSTFGNRGTSPTTDFLGTTDYVDLLMITNNMERLRILSDGNIQIKRSLDIGANLKVDSSVVLNDKAGTTINKGPFTVSENSPTLLSGTLTVDLATDLNASLNVDGPTDLNSTLNVNNQQATKLTGTLQVQGVTTLLDSFYVSASKPSTLTGSLRVDSNATFRNYVKLTNAALEQDTSSLVPTGALQVAGGAGIGGNLTIGGSAKIGGGLSLGNLKVTDTTSATSTTTGAMTVAGGVGINKQLYVGGKTVINNSMEVNSGNGQVVITGGTNGAEDVTAAYPLVVNGKTQGIEVKLTATGLPEGSNNFMTFKDNNNVVRGRIEGQTTAELNADPWYRWDVANYTLYVVFAGVDVGLAVGELVAASTDFRPCTGFGFCITTPSIGTIVVKALVLAAKIVYLAQQTVNLVGYVSNTQNNIGVSYSSGSGDYAEWLPKTMSNVKLLPGQVVGVQQGRISLRTQGAERVLVISTNPIVLGNTPDEGKEMLYEKVAFLGQVPVRLTGSVKAGDYILASNNNDGLAIAKDPEDMTIDDLPNFIGIAWTGSDQEGAKAIKVAVGLSSADLKTMVQKIQKKLDNHDTELNDLKKQINANNAMLSKLLPGYKATDLQVEQMTKELTSAIASAPVKQAPQVHVPVKESANQFVQTEIFKSDIFRIMGEKLKNREGNRLPEMDDAFVTKLLEWGGNYVKSDMGEEGAASMEVLNAKLRSDPAFKADLYKKIKETYNKKIAEYNLLPKE